MSHGIGRCQVPGLFGWTPGVFALGGVWSEQRQRGARCAGVQVAAAATASTDTIRGALPAGRIALAVALALGLLVATAHAQAPGPAPGFPGTATPISQSSNACSATGVWGPFHLSALKPGGPAPSGRVAGL